MKNNLSILLLLVVLTSNSQVIDYNSFDNELIDRLGVYSELGIDEIIVSASFGQSQGDLVESMYRISDHVMPYFNNTEIIILRLINFLQVVQKLQIIVLWEVKLALLDI